ncbi:MAG TPA: sigma-70 family RNA polymerase sigma factor [Phycisphaerae bacterium]|nr:sigma-70 family RNA polymerase sigma factor [Phycisphaerae bacterium]
MAEAVETLVERSRAGDANAFAELIGRYERSALAVAYGLLSDGHRAGDAVQEAFLKAWQELPRLSEAKRFGGWLMQIVRNAAVDIRRRKAGAIGKALSSGSEMPDIAARNPGPAAHVEEEERSRRVREALGSLDELTRTMVTLRYYEGLSSQEIGARLDVTPAAVDMRLSRARGRLKEMLAEVVLGAAQPGE